MVRVLVHIPVVQCASLQPYSLGSMIFSPIGVKTPAVPMNVNTGSKWSRPRQGANFCIGCTEY